MNRHTAWLHQQVVEVAKHWPLATARQAKKQAVRLLRAKRYLRDRNIDAMVVNSEFKYEAGPKVLA